MSEPVERVAIVRGADAALHNETIEWALGRLARALAERGIALGNGEAGVTLRLTTGDAADTAATAAGVTLPRATEAFALFRAGGEVVAWGFDTRGLMYAITELADRTLDRQGDLFGALPLVEQPATRIRAVARAFVSEVEDKPWLYDRAGWVKYLDMLAANRFNRFTLNLGIGYDYPYHNNMLSDVYLHFAYPFLVDLPQYGIHVEGLSEVEREQNLGAFRFIGREAARRGLDFQLGLWTERYDFEDVPQTNYQIRGVTAEALPAYCRDSVAFLLREVPQITGLNFRIHVEAGVAEGDYDFWRTVFAAVKAAGRTIELNLHAKGLDEHVLGAARDTGMPIVVAPKYLAEHMGLPYHPSAIREREYPPAEAVGGREQLSTGSRRFTRQSYGDYLPSGRDWGVMFRIWPGTQRVLSWGDPAFAAAYGRSMSFCGADGFEWMEPMTFKGRQGMGIAGGRTGLADQSLATNPDWLRHEYAYRLLGRLSYSPEIGPESWRRYLEGRLGVAAAACEKALGAASRILPLVTSAHGPSVANNCYWPEVYTNMSSIGTFQPRPYGFDMDGPTRFGNAPSFDSQMFPSPRTYIEALLKGTTPPSYTPLDIADWLDGLAAEAEGLLAALRVPEQGNRRLARYAADVEIMAAIGRFFAQKFRTACYAELMLATRSPAALQLAHAHARLAVTAWTRAAQVGDRTYQRDMAFGPGHHMRGTWSSRLPDIEREANDLQVFLMQDAPSPTHGPADADAVIRALAERRPVRRLAGSLQVPPTFTPDEAVTIRLSGSGELTGAQLHYRHVNQGERWKTVPMQHVAGRHEATIPADYTRSNDHLQVYVTAVADGAMGILPGFPDDLAGAPYAVIAHA